MRNEYTHCGSRMIGTERWEIYVSSTVEAFEIDREARRIIISNRFNIGNGKMLQRVIDDHIRELQAEAFEEMYPSRTGTDTPPPPAPASREKRATPADAFGIRVELVDGPLYASKNDRTDTTGALVMSSTLIRVDRGYDLATRRRCAAAARQMILESLPEGELEPLAADLAEVRRKLTGTRRVKRAKGKR